jgi:hypothetical protein
LHRKRIRSSPSLRFPAATASKHWKRFSKGWKTRCIVRYYDYEEIEGRLYPKGIILYNKQFHYRMVLRLKTLYPMQDNE